MSARDVIERMNCQFTCGDMGEPPCWQIGKRLDPPVKYVPCEPCARATNAILSALDAAGYAVVPVEPTEAMYLATCDAWEYHGSGFDQFKREYEAMLTAAKETP